MNGDDLRRDPLEVRKATLASIVAKASPGNGLTYLMLSARQLVAHPAIGTTTDFDLLADGAVVGRIFKGCATRFALDVDARFLAL